MSRLGTEMAGGGDAATGPWGNELSNRQLEVLDVASVDRLEVDISDGPQVVGAVLEDLADPFLQFHWDRHHDLLVVLDRPAQLLDAKWTAEVRKADDDEDSVREPYALLHCEHAPVGHLDVEPGREPVIPVQRVVQVCRDVFRLALHVADEEIPAAHGLRVGERGWVVRVGEQRGSVGVGERGLAPLAHEP